MPRLSPITIGLAVLAVAVFGVAVFVFWFSSGDVPSPVPVVEQPTESPREATPSPRPRASTFAARSRAAPMQASGQVGVSSPPVVVPEPAPVPVPAPPPPPVDAAAITANSDASSPSERPSPFMGRRGLMMARERPQVLSRVDEKLFESMKLPESTRVGIRQINEDHKRQAQAALTAGAMGGSDSLSAAENVRRKAIDSLLGPDDARKFHAQEFAITRQLRRQAREPQPTAPAPPDPSPLAE